MFYCLFWNTDLLHCSALKPTAKSKNANTMKINKNTLPCTYRPTPTYTGETYRRLDDRFSEHLRSMRLGYSDPVGTHFNSPQHSHKHARIAVAWHNHGSCLYRVYIESKDIARLVTHTPDGLNMKE